MSSLDLFGHAAGAVAPVSTEMVPVSTKMAVSASTKMVLLSTEMAAQPAGAPQLPLPEVH